MTKFKAFLGLALLLFLLQSSGLAQNEDVSIMTINGKNISKGEFERIYRKNNLVNPNESQKSLDDYVNLFINFKLKVAEAESLGMDTLKSFRNELSGYRKQLAKPYLINKEIDDQLLAEAYERMHWDVNASHILISIDGDGAPADTLKAWNEAIKIRNNYLNGESFEKLAAQYSADPSAKKNYGNLGYFTGFQMVYPFETAAFNTKPGEISMPVKTRFGYHLILVKEKRQAAGLVKVAHIMLSFADSQNEEEVAKLKNKIGNIWDQLNAGADFAEMAQKYSDDKGSAVKGGELPEFGTGRMVPDFEKVAFGLTKPGEISQPFKTSFGFHIVKLIEKKGIGSLDEMKAELKAKIQRDERANKSKEIFISQLKKEYAFQENSKNLEQFIHAFPDSLLTVAWDGKIQDKKSLILFTANGNLYSQEEYARWIAKSLAAKPQMTSKSEFLKSQFNLWVGQTLTDIEDSNLEKKYPEFRYLMNEYHDGILLFDLSDKMIWSKAIKDTVGLQAYYEASEKRYYWDERAECIIYTLHEKADSMKIPAEQLAVNNQKALNKVLKLAKKRAGKEMSEEKFLIKANTIINKSKSNYLIDLKNERYEKTAYHLLSQVDWKPGFYGAFDEAGEKVFFQIRQILPKTEKSLPEVKGLVTADYQNYLEQIWIEELKQKYKVHVDKEVLSTIR
jgi:peptidyl-prolyl cis-trans isomerase SurA